MSENKRYSFNWMRGHPQFWDNHCDLADCYLTCEDVCELLNELHTENQMLKEQYADDCNEANSLTVKIAELKEELSDVRYDYAMLEVEHSKAKSENEQLKQQLFETSKELLWATSDEVDRALYYEDEVEELRKEIFE